MPESRPPALSRALLVGGGLFAVTALVFARSCDCGFVNFDDPDYVTANPDVRSGLSAVNAGWAFTTGHAANWHPLTWLSLQLDATLFGVPAGGPLDDRFAWGFHFTNVLLHAANVALLFAALRSLTGSTWRSAWVAALFGLHPLHVESVAWVSERKDVLSTLFGLLALWAYAGYVRRPGVFRYALVAAAFALSLLAKPMFVTLPCLLLLLDYWPLRRFAPGWWPAGRLVLEKLPLFALSAACCVATALAQKAGNTIQSLQGYPFGVRLGNAVLSYAVYLRKAVWPDDLAVFYPHPGEALPFGKVALAALLLAGVSAVAVWQWRRRPYLLVGWSWYLGTLVPVIGLIQVGSQALADRYTYFPLVGVSLMAAWAAGELAGRGPRAALAVHLSAAAALLAAAALTWHQEGTWRDGVSLWRHAARAAAPNARAHFNLGQLTENTDPQGALEHYREAVRIEPRLGGARYLLGRLLLQRGEWDAGVKECAAAVEANPKDVNARFNLGLGLLIGLGDAARAREQFLEVLRLDPSLPRGNFYAGRTYEAEKNYPEAVRYYAAAVRQAPGDREARERLTHCAGQRTSRDRQGAPGN